MNKKTSIEKKIDSKKELEVPKEVDDDALELAEAGYVQAYSRKFNLVTAIGFTVGVTGTWEGMVGSIGSALSLGGPSSLLWGFVLGAIGMSFVAASLAELSSCFPTSGGQYYWASVLSPKKYRVFIGWVTAWSTLTTAWIGIVCCCFSVAVQVQAYATFAVPDYEAKRWHVTLIYWLMLTILVLINIYGVRQLKYFNYYVIGVHMVGYLAIIISTTATKKDFNSAKYAFGGFSNLSGWPDGVAWCVGILTASMGFIGIESAVHFAEEIKHASINVPRAIFWPVLVNGIMTIPFLICICFIVPSADTIFSSSVSSTAPSLMIWYESLKNIGGSIFLNALGSSVAFVGGVFSVGSAGRMTYAMSRDKALPSYFGHINEKWEVSIASQLLSTIFPFIIGLIYIWNSTALYGVMSGLTLSYQITYAIPLGLTFSARKAGILSNRGKWRLGNWGYWINAIGFIYLIFTIIFLSFPTTDPTSAAAMNYAVVLVGFGWFLSIVVWFSYGRKGYKGPSTDHNLEALEAVFSARSNYEIDGLDPTSSSNIINEVLSQKQQEAAQY